MEEIYNSLGWQGGTVWQIVAEIKRLRNIESATKILMSELSLSAQCNQFKPQPHLVKALMCVNNAVNNKGGI